jgi:hypothetical protein
MAIRINVHVQNIECCRFPLRSQEQSARSIPSELVHFVFAEKLTRVKPSYCAFVRAYLDEPPLDIDYAQVLAMFQHRNGSALERDVRAEI